MNFLSLNFYKEASFEYQVFNFFRINNRFVAVFLVFISDLVVYTLSSIHFHVSVNVTF